MPRPIAPAALLAAALIAGALAGPARADGPRTPLAPAYVQECGACHVAFPPGLLDAATWQRQMATLGRHYGSDASLDPATHAALLQWLQAHAGSGRRTGPPPPDDRITRSTWFRHEHRDVGAATWQRPSIQSPARCDACHAGAAEGRYGEREIRIPAR